MNRVEGLHHIAITTGDMKGQIEFFTDRLGMELVALYWMHGVENTFHGFLRLNDESSIALVHNPEIAKIPREIGVTHSGNPGANCAPGVMQHLALKVSGHEELLALRDRLRSKGVPVVGPKDHGFCMSIYFAGPENLSLELSYSTQPIDARAWIDPEVVELCGISADELARYKQSSDFDDQGGAVPQPGPDAPGPHMIYPEALYKAILRTSDEKMLEMSENEPPVKVTEAAE
ncbi:MAG: VOC family protein [Minwuia sp.]|uniref:VOC family protein n=1 Tax=Minwuia sp. TaxID=2493630 RepID=UPI003A850249